MNSSSWKKFEIDLSGSRITGQGYRFIKDKAENITKDFVDISELKPSENRHVGSFEKSSFSY